MQQIVLQDQDWKELTANWPHVAKFIEEKQGLVFTADEVRHLSGIVANYINEQGSIMNDYDLVCGLWPPSLGSTSQGPITQPLVMPSKCRPVCAPWRCRRWQSRGRRTRRQRAVVQIAS